MSGDLWRAASAAVAATCALCNHLNSYCTFLTTHTNTHMHTHIHTRTLNLHAHGNAISLKGQKEIRKGRKSGSLTGWQHNKHASTEEGGGKTTATSCMEKCQSRNEAIKWTAKVAQKKKKEKKTEAVEEMKKERAQKEEGNCSQRQWQHI